ncbi:MAG: hypothetical protein KatS3mg027_0142 [Bacteroidia bacterium]|nr:MAG: hypothetical protein KatS3mg027_0142 [Bacteroidia bacterium]
MILITCGGGIQGLTLIKNLKAFSKDIQICVIDFFEDNISKYFVDDYFISPPVSEEKNYVNFIKNIVEKNSIKYVLPATAIDLKILSELKDDFIQSYNCQIICPSPEIVGIFLDKKKTINYFQENGLPIQNVVNPYKKESYPLFVKKNDDWGGRNCMKLDTFNDFEKIFLSSNSKYDVNKYVFVPYLESFEEFSYDFSVSYNGNVSDFQIRKRIKIFSGFAVISEYHDITYLQSHEKIINKIKQVFSNSKFYGFYNIQVLSANEQLFISDVNPRMGTSSLIPSNNLQIINNVFSRVNDIQSYPINFKGKCVRYIEEKWLPKINKEKIKGIVFDLDNTLIDQNKFFLDRASIFYSKFLHKYIKSYDHYCEFALELIEQKKLDVFIDLLIERFKLNIEKQVLIDIYRTCFPDTIVIKNHVYSLLNYLKKKKYKLFILTENPSKSQRIKIHLANLEHYFDDIFISEDFITTKKDINFFNLIHLKYNISNDSLVMVGDSLTNDILPSIKAGYAYSFYLQNIPLFNTSEVFLFNKYTSIIRINDLNELKSYL